MTNLANIKYVPQGLLQDRGKIWEGISVFDYRQTVPARDTIDFLLSGVLHIWVLHHG